MPTRAYRKPVLPVLNMAEPLCRGLIFAVAPGWEKGFAVADSTTGSRDMRWSKRRTAINTSPAAAQFVRRDFGRAMRPNGTSNQVVWTTATKVSALTGRGSMAILYRASGTTIVDKSAFGNRAEAGNSSGLAFCGSGADGKMRMRVGSGPFSYYEAIATTSVSSTASQLWVGYHDDRTDDTRIFLNARLEDTDGTADNMAAGSTGCAMFGGTLVNGDIHDGTIGLALVWNRQLQPQEIARLWVDPYRVFLNAHQDAMFGPGMAPTTGAGSFFFMM